jgi:hypothetical protein
MTWKIFYTNLIETAIACNGSMTPSDKARLNTNHVMLLSLHTACACQEAECLQQSQAQLVNTRAYASKQHSSHNATRTWRFHGSAPDGAPRESPSVQPGLRR